jgi:hypothetical protein
MEELVAYPTHHTALRSSHFLHELRVPQGSVQPLC